MPEAKPDGRKNNGGNKQTRGCQVCKHPQRNLIDRDLVDGTSHREICAKYGIRFTSPVQNHATNHIPNKLKLAKAAAEVTDADILILRINKLEEHAKRLMEKSEGAGEHRVALLAVREHARIYELLARVAGLVEADKQQVQIAIVESQEWYQLRTKLISALEQHPEALEDVMAVLSGAVPPPVSRPQLTRHHATEQARENDAATVVEFVQKTKPLETH